MFFPLLRKLRKSQRWNLKYSFGYEYIKMCIRDSLAEDEQLPTELLNRFLSEYDFSQKVQPERCV